jgi:LuxR family maltose regulon positive regulatory protein
VSVATVKWHLYNLYTKLGVSSRSAALARARALSLLAR